MSSFGNIVFGSGPARTARPRSRLSALATMTTLVILAGGLSVPAQAASTVFFASGTFQDGSVLSGTITVDTTAGQVTAGNLSLTAPSSFTFVSVQGQGFNASANGYQVTIRNGAGTEDFNFIFPRPNLIGYTGGTLFGNLFNLATGTAGVSISSGTVSTTPPNCTYSFPFNPATTTITWPAGGGVASILLQTQTGCPWTASSNASWLPIAAGSAGGTSQSQVAFNAQANNTPQTRTGTVVIAGITINVSQASNCTYSFPFNPATTTIAWPAGGGGASILLQTQAGCQWTASSNNSWLPIDPGSVSGTGQSQVVFNAQPNNTPQTRTGTVVIAGISINVTQASNCTYSFNFTPPGPVSFQAGGGAASILLITQPGCQWTASSSTSWLPIDPGSASGTGQSQVVFNAQANNTGQTRNGSVVIAGTTINVTQTSNCTFSFLFNPATTTVTWPAGGGGASILLQTQTGCQWTASSNAPWLTIDAGSAGGTGQSQVLYIATVNNTGQTRTGTVVIAGTTINVSQASLAALSLSCSLSSGPTQVGVSYSTTCTASGGTQPYLFSLNGSLPGGLNSQTNGSTFSVSGAPGQPGSYSYGVVVQDSAASRGTASVLFAGTISPGANTLSLVCSPSSGPSQANVSYSSVCTASGGTQPYLFSLNGSLPAGLSTQSAAASITISGTPSQSGSYSYSVTVQDNSNPRQSNSVPFAGTIGSGGPSSSRFVPVTPCRIADTRNSQGTFGGPIMTGGSTRTFPVTQGNCNIPTTAAAYSLNFTVVPTATLSYLTTWPSGQAQPFVSTLNSFEGRIVANAAIVPAGGSGSIDVFVTDSTHVIIDINGYFDPASPSALPFYNVAPCRVSDTRNASGAFGGPSMSGNETRAVPVTQSPCGVPASAQAVSLNATVVPRGTLGYLTLWPAGGAQPFVSTLNSLDGRIVANAAIVPTGGGSVDTFVTNGTDLILDVNGYFGATGTGTPLSFYPVTPCRVADTRNGNGNFGGPSLISQSTRSFPVPLSNCNIPSSARAYSLNVTVVPKGSLPYLTIWPSDQAQPFVSTLNSFTGGVAANAAIVPASSSGSVSVFVAGPSDVILDINGYFAP